MYFTTGQYPVSCNLRGFNLKKINNSSITRLVASLYDSKSISDNDLMELSKFIEDKTGGGKYD